jgi:hypothetical protein
MGRPRGGSQSRVSHPCFSSSISCTTIVVAFSMGGLQDMIERVWRRPACSSHVVVSNAGHLVCTLPYILLLVSHSEGLTRTVFRYRKKPRKNWVRLRASVYSD